MKTTWIGAVVAAALLAPAMAPAEASAPRVALETSKGRIVVELDQAAAPLSVANFLAYVDDGFYAGTVFHRVIEGFMIQGGGFTTDLAKKPVDSAIHNEAKNGLKNVRGTIAMARTNQPHSATSQFYINTVDNEGLDYPSTDGWGYAVFGRVVEGMDVVDAIAGVATGQVKGMANVPLEPVVVASATRLTD